MRFIKVDNAMKGETYINPTHIVTIEPHPNVEGGSLISFDFSVEHNRPGGRAQMEPARMGVTQSVSKLLAALEEIS